MTELVEKVARAIARRIAKRQHGEQYEGYESTDAEAAADYAQAALVAIRAEGAKDAAALISSQAAEIAAMREALEEIRTNGRWSEGEQHGEWIISKAVYDMIAALAHTPSSE